MYISVDNDFYRSERETFASMEGTIIFKHSDPDSKYPAPRTFERRDYDWYILVALQKADQVKKDRHLLTGDLILVYRNAIREGYNHQLDPALQNRWDIPRNKNTIEGIKGYIKRIFDKQEQQFNSNS